ncbi:hypothetical protein EES44_13140 [Streptomyces sp. ADI96-15]|nr:hypothetical protein EES44_13140 [Streptomyces sp. ADI96-15]
MLAWRVGWWLISRRPAWRARARCSACGGSVGEPNGPKPMKRSPGGSRRSPRVGRCSAGAGTTAAIRRWRARRRSAARTAVGASPPGVLLAERRVALRLLRRGTDLVWELVCQPPVALVDLGRHLRVEPELLGDTLGAHRGLVVHAARAVRTRPQQTALAVADGGGLDGVLLLLAGDEGPPSGPACLPSGGEPGSRRHRPATGSPRPRRRRTRPPGSEVARRSGRGLRSHAQPATGGSPRWRGRSWSGRCRTARRARRAGARCVGVPG